MVFLVNCKNEENPNKNEGARVVTRFSPLWKLYVAMETRVLIKSGPKPKAAPTPMMIQIKFDCNLPTSLNDIHV